MKIIHKTVNRLLAGMLLLILSATSHAISYSTTREQLDQAKVIFHAATRCRQSYPQDKKQALSCLSRYASMRSRTKQKKLAHWLATIQLININHCNSTEKQLAKKYSQRIPAMPHIVVCVHYYQKPFQKTAILTIGQDENTRQWKIIAVKEL